MELESLGAYRLVAPLDVPPQRNRATCQFYLARHLDEPANEPPSYVVKLLVPPRDESRDLRRAQFAHEAQLLQAFNHACIPTVHAAGEQNGVQYMVMDRVDGVDLANLLGHRPGATPRALPKEVAVYVLGQLSDALRYAHGVETMEPSGPESLAFVHRNLNPSHVLLSTSGDAVLCGFGSSRSRWLASVYDDPQAGECAYMAPERLTGPANDKTDLFALAVILWETLRGERCLQGGDDAQTREQIHRFDISQSSRRVSGLSSKLSEVLRKNLDRDPNRRYEGAYQVLQRLSQAPEAKHAEQARHDLARLVQSRCTPTVA